jgi:hypothetical protein
MRSEVTPANLPNTDELYELLVRLHDDVRQIQYPYSAKVLKWGIISETEIEAALAIDEKASEVTVWAGEKPPYVAARLAGGLTNFVDQEGYRQKWMEAGLAEGSWRNFLEQYCMLKASPVPFKDPGYLRQPEMENLLALVEILDHEIFSNAVMSGPTQVTASFKSKWWKECHRIFAEAAMEAVYRRMDLSERPKHGLCHTPEWNAELKSELRDIAKRWATSRVWDQPQGTGQGEVDFTNNNEATVKKYLKENGFTTHYLEGRA